MLKLFINGVLYKIGETTKDGLTLENKFEKIFIPIEEAILTRIILPCENYYSVKLEQQAEDAKKLVQAIMPDMFDQMIENIFPKMMNSIYEEFGNDESDFSAVLAVKFQKFVKDEISEADMRKLIQSKKSNEK
jgi:hypothetical protein